MTGDAVPQQQAADPATTTGSQVAGHRHHRHHRGGGAIRAASDVLDESSDDIAAALRSGQSLADIAASKGVGKDDLASGIAKALQAGNTSLSTDSARRLATDLATAVPGAGAYLSVDA